MTVERLSLRRGRPALIAAGELTDSKTIIGPPGRPRATSASGEPGGRRRPGRPRRGAAASGGRGAARAGCGWRGAGRPTPSPPTGPTCATTAPGWRAGGSTCGDVGEDGHHRLRRPPDGARAQGVDGQAGAGGRCAACTGSWPGRRSSPSTRPPTWPCPEVPRGLPKALREEEVEPAARRRSSATTPSPGATGRSSRSSTAPGCASPSWSACRWPTSTSGGCPGPGVRQGVQGADRAPRPGRPRRPRRAGWPPGGRDLMSPKQWARRGDAEAVFPQPPGRAAEPPGGLGRRPQVRRAGRAWPTG